MKNIIAYFVKLFLIALSTICMVISASCQKEKLVGNSSATTSNTINVKVMANYESGTKTYIADEDGTIEWNDGDNIALLEVVKKTNSSTVARVTGTPADKEATFDNKVFNAKFNSINTADLQSIIYYAIYPDKAIGSKINADGLNKVAIDLDRVQKPTATSFGPGADLLIAMPNVRDVKNGEGQASTLSFDFRRIASVGKLRIYGLEKDESIDEDNILKVTFTADKGNVSGKSYFDFNKSGIGFPTSFGSTKDIILEYYDKPLACYTEDGNNYYNVYFTVWPCVVSGGFTLTVETEHYTYAKGITLDEGKTLEFNAGKLKKIKVNFADAERQDKSHESVLPEGAQFVIKSGENTMVVGNRADYLNSVSTAINNTSIEEKDLPAVWEIGFNDFKNKYTISSVYPKKYISATKDQAYLRLVDNPLEATEFDITTVDNSYLISFSGRFIKYDASVDLFKMLPTQAGLSIEACEYSPIVKVSQDNLTVPAEVVDEVKLPLTCFGVTADKLTVAASVDWITTASIEGGDLKLSVATNNGAKREGTVSIKLGGTELATVSVTQQANSDNVKYALLEFSKIIQNNPDDWGTNEQSWKYTQDNGAVWIIKCLYNKDGLNLDSNSKITLPTFVNDIKKIKVTLSGFPGPNRTLYVKSNDDKEIYSQKLDTNEKEYVFDLSDKNVKTCYIKSSATLTITSIEVDAREYLETPAITAPEKGKFELKWTSVNDVKEYDVTVGTETTTVETNRYEFKGAPEWYDVTVVAKAEPNSPDYIDSKPATARCKFGSPTLDTPKITVTSVGNDNISVEWTEDSRATSYSCEIKSNDGTKTINGNSCTFTGLTGGKKYTITVTANSNDSKYDTASTEITVTTAKDPLTGDGSKDKPYTLKDLNTLEDGDGFDLTGKYVTGIVSSVPTLSNGMLTYTIEDEDNNSYSRPVTGKDLGNADFTSSDLLKAGDQVVIYYTSPTANYLYKIGEDTWIFTGIESDIMPTYAYGKPIDFKVYAVYRGKAKEDVTGSCTIMIDNKSVSLPVTFAAGEHSYSITYNKEYSLTGTFSVAERKITYVHEYTPLNMQSTGNISQRWYNISDKGTDHQLTTEVLGFTNYSRKEGYGYIQGGNGNSAMTSTIETSLIPEKIKRITIVTTRFDSSKIVATLYVNKNGNELKNINLSEYYNSKTKEFNINLEELTGYKMENDCTYKFVFALDQSSYVRLTSLTFSNE